MVTQQVVRVLHPVYRLVLSATASLSVSPVLTSVCSALANPHWHGAMEDEYQASFANDTWDLVLEMAMGRV
jgi:hypothetical protein